MAAKPKGEAFPMLPGSVPQETKKPEPSPFDQVCFEEKKVEKKEESRPATTGGKRKKGKPQAVAMPGGFY